jgi:hypothetical protein
MIIKIDIFKIGIVKIGTAGIVADRIVADSSRMRTTEEPKRLGKNCGFTMGHSSFEEYDLRAGPKPFEI